MGREASEALAGDKDIVGRNEKIANHSRFLLQFSVFEHE